MNAVTFTKGQQNAIDGILDFISEPFNKAKYIIGLTGAGGTGKTYITNYIINNCKISKSIIKCTSPTHKACRVFSEAINGKTVDTIQATFGLRLDLKLEDFDPTNPQFNPMATPKLDNIKLLLVDEASMLPAKLVTFICEECKNRKIKIIFIGDAHQLAPVNENKSIAFHRCFKVYNLTEIIRQGETNPVQHVLQLLRKDIDNKSFNFLSFINNNKGNYNYNELGEGYIICNSDKFKELINVKFFDEEYKKNIDMYRVIAYTNQCVAYWNNYIRNTIISDANKNIITKNDLIMSYETVVNDFLEIVINNSEEYIINDIVDFVDDKYGFKGFLVKFQLVHGGKITQPLFVIDSRDRNSIIAYYNAITDLIGQAKNASGAVRVKKWKEYYNFKKKYLLASNIINKNGEIKFSRDIDYGFALTAHKSQGSTYNTVFVDLNDMIYDKNHNMRMDLDDMFRRLYVACSRTKKELILCIN